MPCSHTSVPDDVRVAVFDAFDHGAGSPGHSPGIGIGLSLVAEFASLHLGRAWVEERVGGGTCVRVVLPTSSGASVPD